MTGGHSWEGRVGGAKRSTPCTTTSPPAIFILNKMSSIVIIMYAVVIEPIMHRNNIIAEVLYTTRTLVANVSQLLALHVFHSRPPEYRWATTALCGHSVCFDTCYLRFALWFCRTSSMASALHDAHLSKLRIVLFFDIAGLT